MTEIAKCVNLSRLDLSLAKISAVAVPEVFALPKLESLTLVGTSTDDNALRTLAESKTLKMLALDNTAITDVCAEYIVACPTIESLTFTTTHLTDGGVATIAALPNLRELWINGPEITDATLSSLMNAKSLKRLFIPTDTNVTDQALAEFRNARPEVRIDRGRRH